VAHKTPVGKNELDGLGFHHVAWRHSCDARAGGKTLKQARVIADKWLEETWKCEREKLCLMRRSLMRRRLTLTKSLNEQQQAS
jgi:hypothetical protein